jgi:hydroxymethylpyrimidine pyrophosphatase-like HAD family hydrolase
MQGRSGNDVSVPAAAGPGFFHAVAIDYDGTLADSGRPHAQTLAALSQARASGRKVVIVTGRILSDLQAVFPDAGDYADLIIAENGTVVARGQERRLLAAPVPGELASALAARGVTFRAGEVLLACDATAEQVVLGEVRRLGLECQLIRNRGALMVVPAGASKGAGLAEGLAELGLSCHSTVAIGDAENDHSLLAAAELGVAVGNAVDALKSEADIILSDADGLGVASFLGGPLIAGRQRLRSRRWRIILGAQTDGSAVSIPASQVNVLVTGLAQRGKSYAAGLIAEQLIRLGYSVVVVDPEGDHTGLGRLPGVLVAGSGGSLPSAADLADLVRHHRGGVVLDLSAVSVIDRAGYVQAAQQHLEALRAETGLPHWLVIDEAQVPLARDVSRFFEPAASGYCLVTYRPEDLCPEALLSVDVIVALPGDHAARTAELVAAVGAMPRGVAAALLQAAGPGQAVLVDRACPGTGTVFAIARRETAHMRHWHKYSAGQLRADRRFHFRSDWDTATGATAGSIGELAHELTVCDDEVITHHCLQRDFSRWVLDVLGDPPLAGAIAHIEDTAPAGAAGAAQARAELLAAIRQRYSG